MFVFVLYCWLYEYLNCVSYREIWVLSTTNIIFLYGVHDAEWVFFVYVMQWEHYLMIMIENRRWMAEECDFVHHNNMHSVNTLLLLIACVCCKFLLRFVHCLFLLFMSKINGICWRLWNANHLFFYTMRASTKMTRYVDNYSVFIKGINYFVAVFIRWHAIISNNDADEHHTVWLQLQAIWGGKQCWVWMVGELYKIMNRKWYNSWHQCSLEHIEIMDI